MATLPPPTVATLPPPQTERGFSVINPDFQIDTNGETSSAYVDASGAVWYFGILLLFVIIVLIVIVVYSYYNDPEVTVYERYMYQPDED